MLISALLEDGAPRTAADPEAQALLVDAQQRAEHVERGVLATLVDDVGLAEDAAWLTRHVLRDLDELAGREPRAVVFDVALLALALHRRAALLVGDGIPSQADEQRLGLVARGELEQAEGPLAAFVAAVRAALEPYPGWPAASAAFSAALTAALDAVIRDRRMGALGPAIATHDGDDTTGCELVAIAAGIVTGDRSLALHPSETEMALRLASSTVARARDALAFAEGSGPLAPEQLVARRLAVPPGIVRLRNDEIGRSLVAIFVVELLDMLDAIQGIDPRAPIRTILPRTVGGLLALERGWDALARRPIDLDREHVMTALREEARRDGRITSDERALLRGMDAHLLAFTDLLARVDEDRVVDFDEFVQLRNTRAHVLDDLLRIALADDVITDDERGLLVRALELLPALRPGRR